MSFYSEKWATPLRFHIIQIDWSEIKWIYVRRNGNKKKYNMKPNNKKNETHEGNKIKITLHCRISCGLHEINMSCVSFSFLALPHFYNVPQLFRIVHHFLSMVFLFISSSIFGKTKSNEKYGYGKRWRRSETERNRERTSDGVHCRI